jgi:putative SOS response-associated peptidase YedK
MCGRFTLTRSAAEIAEHFGLDAEPEIAARFNVAPGQPIALVREGPDGERLLETRHWGLVPHWARDAKGSARTINARAETLAEKPAFREAARRRRCLVPADGFYEWKAQPPGRARPHHVSLPGGSLFAMAGLFENWIDPDGNVLETVTVVTREANEAVRSLHHRMPLIPDPESYRDWLQPSRQEPGPRIAALAQTRALGLKARPVDFRVNNVRNEDAECLADPRTLEELPLFRELDS